MIPANRPTKGSTKAVTAMVAPAAKVLAVSAPLKLAEADMGTLTIDPKTNKNPEIEAEGIYLAIFGTSRAKRIKAMAIIKRIPAAIG